jgi:hypothetical protein
MPPKKLSKKQLEKLRLEEDPHNELLIPSDRNPTVLAEAEAARERAVLECAAASEAQRL